MTEPPRREITDVRALRALAHPVRLDLLNLLLAHGPQTASQCADAVGSTPSNCSYHLRHLARFGFVEPVGTDDRRERPWRAAAPGFRFAAHSATPAVAAAEQALTAAQIQRSARAAQDFVTRRDTVDPAWREAFAFNTYALMVSPAELAELTERLDALIRPLRTMVRADPPHDAAPVHLDLAAFPLHTESR